MFMSPPQHGIMRVIAKKGVCNLLTDFPTPLNAYDLGQIKVLASSGIIFAVPGTESTYEGAKNVE